MFSLLLTWQFLFANDLAPIVHLFNYQNTPFWQRKPIYILSFFKHIQTHAEIEMKFLFYLLMMNCLYE